MQPAKRTRCWPAAYVATELHLPLPLRICFAMKLAARSARLQAYAMNRDFARAASCRRRARPGRTDMTGCPWHDVKSMLRQVGLRPTRQRMALGWILFAKGDRHLTAEMLYEEASGASVPVSLATVYNTLHQFTEVGLLRQVAVDGSQTYFDTNVSRPPPLLRRRARTSWSTFRAPSVLVGKTAAPPEGYRDRARRVVVRLRRASSVDCSGRSAGDLTSTLLVPDRRPKRGPARSSRRSPRRLNRHQCRRSA